MKNTLAENLLRFGVKNLSESEKQKIHESLLLEQQYIDKRDWANKQTEARKNLNAQYAAQKFPITPIVIGPYCLAQVENIAGQSVASIKNNDGYMGDLIGWTVKMGLPSIQNLKGNEVGYFTYHPVDGFKSFLVETQVLDNSINGINEAYSRLSVPMLQQMWKNIAQATELTKKMPALKTNILAYQANPADTTKGYDKITGRAAEFLKSIKFA